MGAIPPAQNGIGILEGEKEFNKENCFWTHKHQGRPKINKEIKVSSEKCQTIGITCRIKCKLYEKIKETAYQKSLKAGKYIQVNDLIRDILSNAYPELQERDLFGNVVQC